MNTEWSALKTKLDSYQSVYDAPISSLAEVNTIPDAPICGGGKVTVAVDGTHREVNYHLSKSDFWHVMLHPGRLFDGFSISPAPLCRLALTVNNADGKADHGRHVQDMAVAEIRSVLPLEGGTLEVRCTALAQRGLVIYELEARGATASLSAAIEAESEHNNFYICKGKQDEETVWLRKEHQQLFAVNAAVAMRPLGATNVRSLHEQGGAAALSFDVPAGQTVRLLLSVAGGKEEFHHLEEALAGLEMDGQDARPTGEGDAIDEMLNEHADWWQAFWLKSWLDLGDSLLERYYYGAQYVHGCSIDLEGRVVPGLAGGWITHPTPIWGGNYTMNYNGEAPFWGLPSSNRGEFTVPYAKVCIDYIAAGRKLAKRLDTKGIVMPVMIGPWGVPNHDDALWQKSNASLAAITLIWHYEGSRERAFLEETLYPYIRELMDFWEDNLTLDSSGRYVIENSAQRERTPGDLNPGSELAAVRRITGAALEYSETLGVDAERRELWQDYLARLSDYPVMEVDGDLCYVETENRMDVSLMDVGDNPVVLDHVYPHGAIDSDTTGKGCIIARNTLRYLNSWNQDNGFPRIFGQAVRAEWPGGDLLDIFKARLTSEEGPHEILRRNNTFLPRDHSYEGSGTTEFLNSMLAQAHGGVLKVFHVWPKDRDAAFKRIRVKGAFLVSGELKDGEVAYVDIHSEQGGPCRMLSCWSGRGIAVERIDAHNISHSVCLADMECGDEVTALGAAERRGGSTVDIDSSDSCSVRGARAPRSGKAAIPSPHSITNDQADTQNLAGPCAGPEVSEDGDFYTWGATVGTTYRVTSGAAVSREDLNLPLILVPVIEPAAHARRDQTQAMLDVLLTPEVQNTRIEFDVIFADESRQRCADLCRFRSRDEQVARVADDGEILAVGPGRTVIDVQADVDGCPLKTRVSVEVLEERILPMVGGLCGGVPEDREQAFANHIQCILRGDGMDGPGIGARHRICPYPFFVYGARPGEKRFPLTIDFGSVQPVDEMHVWNYNAPNDFRVLGYSGGAAIGLRDVTIEYSEDGEQWQELESEGHPFRLAQATGEQWMPATNLEDGSNSPIRFHGAHARYVRISPSAEVGVGNWGAECFGLSQVRFTGSQEGQ
ncbi:MAG: discoidin domain-containing protein [Verrucomicrobia bacterium]|nr:discoidin domain-containing protein [Verrucomicrobiota bacterium]